MNSINFEGEKAILNETNINTENEKLNLSIDNKFFIKTHRGVKGIYIPNIKYCVADGCYTEIFIMGEKSILVCKRIKEIEQALHKFNIIRCHDSYLVNVVFIKEITGTLSTGKKIILTDNTEIACSRRRYKNLQLKLVCCF